MEDMDFERRREQRRQKREEMRIEAERLAKNDEDEEEAARERRRRARQERLKSRDGEEPCGQTEVVTNRDREESCGQTDVGTNSHSVTETVSVSSSYSGGGDEEEQALLDRMAKREERRLKRMKEALERQRDLDGAVTGGDAPGNSSSGGGDAVEKNANDEEERQTSWRRGRYRDNGEEEEEERQQQKPVMYSSSSRRRREEEEEEEKCEEEEVVEEEVEQRQEEEEVEEEKPRRSYMREQESTEEHQFKMADEENNTEETNSVVSGNLNSNQGRSSHLPSPGDAETWDEVAEGEGTTDSTLENVNDGNEDDNEVSEILCARSGVEMVNERGGARQERGSQNGGVHEDAPPKQLRKPERTPSRSALRSPEASAVAADNQDEDADARLEAERKLEELKRRRDDAETEEFERMRQKQQEAEVQLEELRGKREERRKVLEEEERQRKQEEADRKAREEEEKRRMKEEIERRRAEAAEKRQKGEEILDGEGKPFKCVSPRGSSLKIEERTEFLNKSAQRSSVKQPHSPVVSKIEYRLEQYTSAAQRENRESRSPRSGVSDLPMVTDGIRSIKSMWQKGNVFSSPGGGAGVYKETAVVKIGVAGRINDWLNKTPESGKTTGGGRPADLKPVDVTNKRSLWENKGTTPTKMTGRGEAKSVANGMGH